MSIPITLPVGAKVRVTENRFTSTFNVPTVNRYDFGTAVNVDVPILRMDPNTVYILERLNFSMNIPEGIFQDSIDEVTKLRVRKKSTRQLVWQNPTPFINYVKNLELYNFVETDQEDDFLIGTFVGKLIQVPETVGKIIITAFVQFNIYEIDSTEWNNYFRSAKRGEGSGIPLRGGDPRNW